MFNNKIILFINHKQHNLIQKLIKLMIFLFLNNHCNFSIMFYFMKIILSLVILILFD
jgi:hypothetical protein